MAKTDTAHASTEMMGPGSIIAVHHDGDQYPRPTEGKALANLDGWHPDSEHAKERRAALEKRQAALKERLAALKTTAATTTQKG